eukprot:1893001-Prymnesium_polylepis.1
MKAGFRDYGELEILRTENERLGCENANLKRQLSNTTNDAQALMNAGQRKAVLRMLRMIHSDKRIVSQTDAVAALTEMLDEVTNKQQQTQAGGSSKKKRCS